jgi:AcrR family transcriptional regulator
MSRARDSAIAAATALFSDRGYSQATIREIAALANLSTAMVMKCVGSKQELFHKVAAVTPLPLPASPRSDLGQALVRDLVDRFDADTVEPTTRAIMLRLTAPDRTTRRW